MIFSIFIGLVLVTSLHASSSDATICKPMSKFKIDCDVCFCSENGKEYTCQPGICDTHGGKERFDDPNLIISNNQHKLRKPRVIPYLNDEMNEPKNDEEENEFVDDAIYDEDINDQFQIDVSENINK